MARKAKPKSKPSSRDALIDAALTLAATKDWAQLSLPAIADEAGVPLAEALGHFASKGAVLAGAFRRIDQAVLDGMPKQLDPEDTIRDRLFELLMGRIDQLAPHKAAVRNLLCGLRERPIAAFCHLPRLQCSMRLMLEAAGTDTSGLSGILKTKGLIAVYLNALRVWLDDDSADMAPTMAALDRGLMQAEKLAAGLWVIDRGDPKSES